MNHIGGGVAQLRIIDEEHANAVKRLFLSTQSGARSFSLNGRTWQFDTHNWKMLNGEIGSVVPIVPVQGEPSLKLTAKEEHRIVRGQWT
ncbi:hypothetical protein [Microbaculum marinum]|uniref:Uncharacterized protein n=1 Tax=Microbaculum marinum TaxID=1764581 RepID=A0AAW9S022_9HYPH